MLKEEIGARTLTFVIVRSIAARFIAQPKFGGRMTRNEIIEKTLRDMKVIDPTETEFVVAELQRRLPDAEIKTCDDFKQLNATCCETCHTFYAHYEMDLIDLPDGAKAWVCAPVKWAIYPERYQQLQDWSRNSPEGKLLRRIFGEDEPDEPS
jgi:hypothetical protein